MADGKGESQLKETYFLTKLGIPEYGVDNFEDLTLIEDAKNEGLNRGFAFLDFSCRDDALDACKHLQKMDVVFGTDRTADVAFADTFIEPDDEIMAQVKTVFTFVVKNVQSVKSTDTSST